MRTLLLSIALSGLSLQVMATPAIPGFSEPGLRPSTITDKAIAKTGLSTYQDDITADQGMDDLTLDSKALHEAQVWGLSVEEEKRYLALMKNRSAFFYEGLHLTPIDILGLNARNDAERTHFAQLAAHIEAQKVAQNLAWNQAFYKAYNTLFEGQTVIDSDFDPRPYSPVSHTPVQLKAGDELFLFIRLEDSAQSMAMMLSDAVLKYPGTRLHFMILKADNAAIQALAHRFGLAHELVQKGLITLNHGELHYESLSLSDKQTPLLVLVRKGHSSLVDLGKI
ncbi:TIGR03759 family integrating conjugative element protein [Legionella fairfieldensis]|uniref:TIGR03759 family integrating conjugative element protein n=1 Tax=Legionella fairfieldensis TaxID=45064 RepID=UPI00048F54AD|nr:TIGR03759 family integrating conjugative element protein [Legionella fairfieldensis]